jgi:hypothetical protein
MKVTIYYPCSGKSYFTLRIKTYIIYNLYVYIILWKTLQNHCARSGMVYSRGPKTRLSLVFRKFYPCEIELQQHDSTRRKTNARAPNKLSLPDDNAQPSSSVDHLDRLLRTNSKNILAWMKSAMTHILIVNKSEGLITGADIKNI